MKEKIRRKPKMLLTMNARNRVTSEVSVPNSNPRIKEHRIERRPSKLLGMTPPNSKIKRSNKKWPTFALWLFKTKMKYLLLFILLLMIVMIIMMIMMMMMMMMMRALL